MEQHKIDRINELSRLSRERALTAGEAAEREALRGEYRASIRQSLQAHLDNTYPEGLLCEHGLSLVIEHEGHSILLDAGSSAALLDNAARLGVDLSRVDAAVLSHGHYDHSGGFCAFFQRNPSAPLYLREEAAQPSYVLRGDARKYLGVPQELLSHGARLHYVTARTELFPGVWLLPHNTPGLERRIRCRRRPWPPSRASRSGPCGAASI